jgi:hypothetical protein
MEPPKWSLVALLREVHAIIEYEGLYQRLGLRLK